MPECAEMISILKEQLRVFKLFKELGEAKTSALVKGRYGDLERIVQAEELLVVEMGRLEQQRLAQSGRIAQSLGARPEEVTLARLRGACPAGADELDKLGEQFAAVTRELGELNQLNQELIRQSLQYLDFTVRLLTGAREGHGYNPGGDERPAGGPAASRLFNRLA